jgi:DNA topoisomerase III
MTQLFICEKPSQARDIATVLGATQKSPGLLRNHNTVVTWCFGHLLEMAQPEDYDPHYKHWALKALPIIPMKWKTLPRIDAKKQLTIIKKQLLSCSEVIIATDADREGEVIAREILDYFCYQGPLKRLWLSALDQHSIRRALDNLLPDKQTRSLYHAGLARARADWLVGMNLTRLYTLIGRQAGHRSALFSVGRVQTPTLQLVVDRDRKIESFAPAPFWDVTVTAQTKAGDVFAAKWIAPEPVSTDDKGRCLSERAAFDVVDNISDQPAMIESVEQTRKTVRQPLGYDLSSLQTEASKRWGMSATQTLQIAQSLYEKHKLISYPRTACAYFPESQWEDAPAIVSAIAGNDVSLKPLVDNADTQTRSKTWNQSKVDSTSHHAIIPTNTTRQCLSLTSEEKQIYQLICRRYVSQFYPVHEYLESVVTLLCCGESLMAKGKKVLVSGWTVAVKEDNDETKRSDTHEQRLPALQQNEHVDIVQVKVNKKHTTPPPRYSEGTLIQAMKSVGRQIDNVSLREVLRDTSGLGQEATRAGILTTLRQRGYIQSLNKKSLISTETGRILCDAVPVAAKDPLTTALWEQSLDDIAQSRITIDAFMQQQSQWVVAMIKQIQSSDEVIKPTGNTVCSDCKHPMQRKKSKKSGKYFWGCSDYPNCLMTLPDVRGKPKPQ